MKLRVIRQFLLCFTVLISCSCVKRERFTDYDRLKIKIQIARLSDVPMPLGIRPLLDYVGDDSFGYTLDDLSLDLLSYYLSEMDQCGWNLVGVFDSVEKVLFFEKPHKLVSINIRKQKNQFFVIILAINK